MKTEEKFNSILAITFNIDISEVKKDLSDKTLKQWDSLKQMNLIVAIEEEFKINFDEAESILLKDYQSLLRALKNKLNL